jgi:hypothetical protein
MVCLSSLCLSKSVRLVSGRLSVGHGLSKSNRDAKRATTKRDNEISLEQRVLGAASRTAWGPGSISPADSSNPR